MSEDDLGVAFGDFEEQLCIVVGEVRRSGVEGVAVG